MSINEQLSLFDEKKRYPTVSTVEKRLLLEKEGKPWPVCDCCGIPKKWSSARHVPAGGGWHLRCTATAHAKKYREKPLSKKLDRELKWKHRRTPGTHQYNSHLKRIEDRMQKYIEGTEENKQYKERLYQSWTKSTLQS